MAGEDYLFDFYGTECPHCIAMEPLIARLEKEEGLKLTKYEVWHNAANAALLAQYDQDYCGGVPFFYNKKTGKWICGSTTYEKFRDWARGK